MLHDSTLRNLSKRAKDFEDQFHDRFNTYALAFTVICLVIVFII